MILIEKGRKPREICRQCRALHANKACPVMRANEKRAQELLAFARAYRRLLESSPAV